MSLVVGITCDDGAVIACDCASTARVNGTLARQKFYCDKFHLNPRENWGCAWAGGRASVIASAKLSRRWRTVPAARRLSPPELIEQLQAIGDEAFVEIRLEDPRLGETASCLVAYEHASPAGLWSKVELYELNISATSTCTRIKPGSPKFIGDYINPAAFFGWSLYADAFHQYCPAVESAFLAGFTVAAAHSFNPLAVDGLSILLCKPGNFTLLDDRTVEEIKKQSHEIGNEIWNNLRQHCISFRERMCLAPEQAGVIPFPIVTPIVK